MQFWAKRRRKKMRDDIEKINMTQKLSLIFYASIFFRFLLCIAHSALTQFWINLQSEWGQTLALLIRSLHIRKHFFTINRSMSWLFSLWQGRILQNANKSVASILSWQSVTIYLNMHTRSGHSQFICKRHSIHYHLSIVYTTKCSDSTTIYVWINAYDECKWLLSLYHFWH